MKQSKPVTFVRELFTFADGGTIAIDWVDSLPQKNDSKPLLIVIPGLAGGSRDCYVLNILIEAKLKGF